MELKLTPEAHNPAFDCLQRPSTAVFAAVILTCLSGGRGTVRMHLGLARSMQLAPAKI